MRIHVRTKSVAERTALLGAAMSLGYMWHGNKDECPTPESVEKKYRQRDYPTVNFDSDADGRKSMSGSPMAGGLSAAEAINQLIEEGVKSEERVWPVGCHTVTVAKGEAIVRENERIRARVPLATLEEIVAAIKAKG